MSKKNYAMIAEVLGRFAATSVVFDGKNNTTISNGHLSNLVDMFGEALEIDNARFDSTRFAAAVMDSYNA